MATHSGGAEVKVDANGVLRVGRAKRVMLFADMSHLQPAKKKGKHQLAKDCAAEDNSRQEKVADAEDETADMEIADAAKEDIAEDNPGQKIPEEEVADGASIADAAEEVIAEDNSGQEIPDEEAADGAIERALEDILTEDKEEE